ncbi:hypothetical protein B0H12DRAFT_313553 [Mycena haematopus]|nr:hypothetical protein B0H12DRAFT_313553 [Mycena haematopus]
MACCSKSGHYVLASVGAQISVPRHRRATPSSSHPPSHPLIIKDQLEAMLTDAIQDFATDHRNARTRAHAHDGHHCNDCMAKNTVDANSFYKHAATKKLQSHTGAAVGIVQTCHILNESILQNIQPDARDCGAWILEAFGLEDVVERLMTPSNSTSSPSSPLSMRSSSALSPMREMRYGSSLSPVIPMLLLTTSFRQSRDS